MKGVEHFPGRDSHWILPYVAKNVFFNGDDGRTMNSDARAYFHYFYTGVTPAMSVVAPGQGSDYAMAYADGDGQPFDGAKTYQLHLPPDVADELFAFTPPEGSEQLGFAKLAESDEEAD